MPAPLGDGEERAAARRLGAPGDAGRSGDVASVGVGLSVLGPLRLTVDGAPVEVPGTKRRAVLAMLAMASPGAISAEQLVDAVWPDEAPRSGRAALQSHVSRLRRHLDPHAARLTGSDAGYRLELAPGELDARRLEDLVRRARATAGDDDRAACELLLEARGLWRGPALADLGELAALAAWGRALTETWIGASDLLVQCALAAGDAATAVAVAAEVAAAEPLREATAILQVRALAAHGRAAEALRVAHLFRTRLGEETGLEPSPALAEVEHAVASGRAGPVTADDRSGEARGRTERDGTTASGHRSAGWGTAGGRWVPVPAAPLLGREAELAGLLRLIDEERVVTVVGPGGVGKTHLALEAARQASSARTAVHVLRLAPVADPSALPTVLEGTLGLDPGVGSGDPVARCALRLRPGRQLLVVDCCEHVLDPARAMVAALVEACPELTVLATSRERLALPVEQTCRLAPLPMPDLEHTGGPAGSGAHLRVASVALFVDRARRVHPHLELAETELGSVARIVRTLDGMPLAIELAAGRLSSMSLRDLEERLDRALDLLGTTGPGPAASGDDRHRTLRAAVEWSYDLLPPDQQLLFRHLAVFPDGADLRTAEEVARRLGVTTDPAIALGHLVDASMIEADLSGPTRYRMLDTLRAFGLDRLEAAGEHETATRRLVAWGRELTAWLLSTTMSEDEPLADARLRAEVANLRAAWRTARSLGDLDAACAMVVDLNDVVAWRDVTEVWAWARELADDPALAGHPHEGAVLATGAEGWWFGTGDLDRAEALATRAMELADPTDERARMVTRWAMADVALFRGRFADAKVFGRAARDGTPIEAEGHGMAALAEAYAGNLDAAVEDLERARAAPASPTIRAFLRYAEGEVAGRRGRWTEAEAAYREALAATTLTGAAFLEGVALVGLVSTLVASGRSAEALTGYRELLDRWERTGAWTQQWTTLRNLADLLAGLGDEQTAAALRQAADRAPEAPARATLVDAPARDQVLDLARAAIDRSLSRSART